MLSTRATERLGIRHPIVQAGMARRYTGAELVAAVSEAGGLGVLGCLNRPVDETVAQIRRIRTLTDRSFGLNFVVHLLDEVAFEVALAERVPVFTFFRGDPERVVARAHATGAVVIYQVTTVKEAERAIRAGADVLIAQGSGAGGHVGPIALSAIVPAVVAVAEDRPVLAAGGIVDGASLAAAMRLGADGAWMGTRFLATPESPTLTAHKQAILDAGPGATVRTTMWDVLWGRPWPGVEVRSIRNALVDRWIGRQSEIAAARAEIDAGVEQAEVRGDAAEIDLLAGEGVGRITDIRPAGELVREISVDADRILSARGRSPST